MKDNKPIAAGFVYLSNSIVSHLEWLISNPDEKVKGSIVTLTKSLVDLSIEKGCTTIMTSYDNSQANSNNLRKLYSLTGFKPVGDSITMMIKSDNIEQFLCEDYE